MASRGELVGICQELGIDNKDLNINEMKEVIRKECDKRFNIKSKVGVKDKSEELLKFLIKEYDYTIKDKEGSIHEYKEVLKDIKDGHKSY